MRITLMSGAGNLFAVLDGFAGSLPGNLAQLAPLVCNAIEPRPDGLLIAARPDRGGDCAMVLYNADGSRPETCGNGLRCVAKLVVDRGHVVGDRFVIETDAGPCPTTVELAKGRVVRARVHMGQPKIVAREVELALATGESVRVTLVDVGNPHCVLFVDDVTKAPVTTLGPRLEKHARFPRGTNVEFLAIAHDARGDEHAKLRVWERGVGETQACGSGAVAAATAAVDRGIARFPLTLELPGGMLEVDSDGAGGVLLSGPVEVLAEHELDLQLPSGRLGAERG